MRNINDEYREHRRLFHRLTSLPTGCWEWQGSTRGNGYGSFAVRRLNGEWSYTTAHRRAYELWHNTTIPPGLETDHLCRNRACCRPDHLELVSRQENLRRRDEDVRLSYPTDSLAVPVYPGPPAPPPKKRQARKRKGNAAPERTHCPKGHEYAVVGRRPNGKRPDGKPAYKCGGCDAERQARLRKGNAAAERTHCPQGHEYTPENTYIKSNGYRDCRTCALERNRRNIGYKGGKPPGERTHCPQGHEYTPENTYINPGRGDRHCYTCRRLHARAAYAKRKAQALN